MVLTCSTKFVYSQVSGKFEDTRGVDEGLWSICFMSLIIGEDLRLMRGSA